MNLSELKRQLEALPEHKRLTFFVQLYGELSPYQRQHLIRQVEPYSDLVQELDADEPVRQLRHTTAEKANYNKMRRRHATAA